MDKKRTNKLDDMELDMVTGGKMANGFTKKIGSLTDSIASGLKSVFDKIKPNLNPPTK